MAKRKKRGKKNNTGVLVGGLLVLGIGGWYLFGRKKDTASDAGTTTPTVPGNSFTDNSSTTVVNNTGLNQRSSDRHPAGKQIFAAQEAHLFRSPNATTTNIWRTIPTGQFLGVSTGKEFLAGGYWLIELKRDEGTFYAEATKRTK